MTARAALVSIALLLLLSFVGCGGGGAHAGLRFELAPTLDCSQATADLPADLQFFTLRVCPHMGGACVPLTDPGGDHSGDGAMQLRVHRPLDRRFTVDARIDSSVDYDVTVVGYSGGAAGNCTPYALGHALGVRFGQGDILVRLYPVGGWSCAGTHLGQMAPVTRALHQAVLLPNRQVLILGGVLGPTAGATAFLRRTLAQRIVEVFDPRDARFHAVTMSDEDGMPGFSRVMFQARYISTNASGQYEIHVYGGFDIDHAPEGGVGFDGNANATTVSALFGPLSRPPTCDATHPCPSGSMCVMIGAMGTCQAATGPVGFRSDAVILYDPTARTAMITASSGVGYTTAAASDGSGMVGVVRSINSVMIPPMSNFPTYGLQAAWYVDGGTQGTLQASRLGASITPLSATRYLVWGGNVTTGAGMALDAATVLSTAGELVATGAMGSTLVAAHVNSAACVSHFDQPSCTADVAHACSWDAAMTTCAAPPDDQRPFATAYHTATHIAGPSGSTAILFAGGLVLGAGPAPLGTSPMASPSLTVARFDAMGTFVGGSRVMRRIGTVLHTATAVDMSGTDILLVGGASTMPGMMLMTLFGEKTTGLVTFDPVMGTYAWRALPDLVSGRWGHTTTIIPNHGVLVVGGISRMDATLTVADSSEFLLWEDLRGVARPASMSCAMATDAGPPMPDAGQRDAGPRIDTGPPIDMGMSRDTGPSPG